MNRKVVRLVELVEQGYEVEGVEPGTDGSLRMRLACRGEAEHMDFDFFEVPAILQATQVVGQAG